jgi:hypothetical protein
MTNDLRIMYTIHPFATIEIGHKTRGRKYKLGGQPNHVKKLYISQDNNRPISCYRTQQNTLKSYLTKRVSREISGSALGFRYKSSSNMGYPATFCGFYWLVPVTAGTE